MNPFNSNPWTNPEQYSHINAASPTENVTNPQFNNNFMQQSSTNTMIPDGRSSCSANAQNVISPLSQGDTLHQITLCNVNVLQTVSCNMTESVSCQLDLSSCNFPVTIKSIDKSRPCIVNPIRTCCEIVPGVTIGSRRVTVYVDYDITVPIIVTIPGENTAPSFCKTTKAVVFENIFESCDIKGCHSLLESATGNCEANTFIVQNEGRLIRGLFNFAIAVEICAMVDRVQVVQKAT